MSSLLAFLFTTVFACTYTPQANFEPIESGKPKHIILMVSDGIGFNGWLAADYYQGLAGKQSYQVERPDGTMPLVFGLEHGALNLIDEDGNVLPRTAEVDDAAGATEQLYDTKTRWLSFENAMINDFEVAGSYTTYTDSAAAGTALLSGRKTSVGRLNMDWSSSERFTTFAEIAMNNALAAGAVSSVMVSHATPAAVISHNVSRNNYADIFNEMIASDLNVIMGAGHPQFNDNGNTVQGELDYKYVGGEATFNAMTSEQGLNGFTFLDSKKDFIALAQGTTNP
ncbi:MAG: alkaline phosphatase, partial [Pseudomonadota bacterium]